jgi:hypothetical protein
VLVDPRREQIGQGYQHPVREYQRQLEPRETEILGEEQEGQRYYRSDEAERRSERGRVPAL